MKELSPRQEQVLVLLKQGVPQKEIAQRLNVSPKTVNTYIKYTAKKLGYQSLMMMIIGEVRKEVMSEITASQIETHQQAPQLAS